MKLGILHSHFSQRLRKLHNLLLSSGNKTCEKDDVEDRHRKEMNRQKHAQSDCIT
jgi:hypothetical protein